MSDNGESQGGFIGIHPIFSVIPTIEELRRDLISSDVSVVLAVVDRLHKGLASVKVSVSVLSEYVSAAYRLLSGALIQSDDIKVSGILSTIMRLFALFDDDFQAQYLGDAILREKIIQMFFPENEKQSHQIIKP